MKPLGKSFLKYQVAILATVAATFSGFDIFPVQAQELSEPPEIIIETEPIDSQQIAPVEVESETESVFSDWRRVRLVHTLPGHQSSISSLLFSPDSSILISGGGSNDANMRFWSVETGKRLTQIRGQSTAILAMVIDPQSQFLVSGGEDSIINIWDWQSGKYRATLFDHNTSVTSLEIAPDGRTLVSGAADGIKVWNLKSFPYNPLYTLSNFEAGANTIAISPNGFLLASGDSEGRVKFWNLRAGDFVSEFFPHEELISGLAFAQNGKVLITASHDRKVKLWDLESGQLIEELTGHTGAIRAIALHPEGKILATGGNDGIILWNLEQNRKLTRLRTNSSWVQSLAFSPNGQYLASGGFDLTVRVWEDSLFEEAN